MCNESLQNVNIRTGLYGTWEIVCYKTNQRTCKSLLFQSSYFEFFFFFFIKTRNSFKIIRVTRTFLHSIFQWCTCYTEWHTQDIAAIRSRTCNTLLVPQRNYFPPSFAYASRTFSRHIFNSVVVSIDRDSSQKWWKTVAELKTSTCVTKKYKPAKLARDMSER